MKKFFYLTTDEHFEGKAIVYNKIIGTTHRNYDIGEKMVKTLPLIISNEGLISKERVVLEVINIKENYILLKVVKL